MREWEFIGSGWVLRPPAIPTWCHWAALVSGLFTYGFGWLAWLLFCVFWMILRSQWVTEDPRSTEEIYAEELR